ncbi:6-phospho-beta-glucosidase [Priestia megaterium]|uniref:6-phospho-beta-glucosidase n=1 Tax=Priestia megaterium TaxID=1404 RepID=A0A6M6E322_PRIMG|nr:6-phospho-beta-glucosidase [Priestia megaterium]KLV31929.1 diacetylchitobiose-6-phosphate hydrolase [Priestia megaterium]MCE4089372.1 6-phospho-beta-glucosidase [Priestia megaterium]MDH3159591.1 6-phospho-beta-glucosidase [Priestia megaterium]MED4113598.1 6-phospho-beta-glucosidase [Priestia megaterium]QJX78838.1 6-phospho-beta-glucosidase [Priestia megaterium]
MKVVTIGGGSSYTPELVEGFIKRYDELPIRELWLVDVEEGKEKLEIVGALAKRMVKKAGVDMKIHLTLDRQKALINADFVTTQLRVGQLDARIQDERIPLKYGMIGQETNGAGGLFKGLRTIPVLLKIAEEIHEVCPNAWLINFTNPAGMVTEALLRYGEHSKVVGVCNLPAHMTNSIAGLLQVEKEDVHIEFAGLNHLVYGLHVYAKGKEVTQEVIRRLSDPNSQVTMRNIAPIPWQPDFLEALGVILCPYHRYYYKTKEILAEELLAFQSGTTRAEVVKALEAELFELYKNPNLEMKPPQLEKRGGAYYSDAACNLISSIYNDKGDIQTLNVKNNGAISSLPNESAVEVNCVVTKQGPVPLAFGELPVEVNGLVQQIKSFERIGAEAAVTGSYEKALVALSINPLVPSDELAKSVLDELLQAHRKYLPAFFKEVNA